MFTKYLVSDIGDVWSLVLFGIFIFNYYFGFFFGWTDNVLFNNNK